MEGDKMKRILSTALAIILALILISCSQNSNSSLSTGAGGATDGFVKPERYTSVLLITINPQFRLYLDENGTVLAVEAVNKDAESLIDSIQFENESFETVIETIVTEANKSGFVKADATIELEIAESKETDKAQTDILDRAEQKTMDIAETLDINIHVTVGEIKPADVPGETEPDESENPDPSETEGPTEPAHIHSFSAATCTEPGKCDCGATEGTALGHDFKDGICARCGEKDPDYRMTSLSDKKGYWSLKYVYERELYAVSLFICNPGEYRIDYAIGAPLSSMPEDMQNSADVLQSCVEFDGQLYYCGMGDGYPFEITAETGSFVTITDSLGKTMLLNRVGENTLQCTTVANGFAKLPGFTVGSEFTFTAE